MSVMTLASGAELGAHPAMPLLVGGIASAFLKAEPLPLSWLLPHLWVFII